MGKIYDGIIGFVVGDALGVPVEFKQRDSYELTDMTGFGSHNQKIGTWSDDSSMTLATLESIVRMGFVCTPDIMYNFYEWFENAKFTPYGVVFDAGNTTEEAILKYVTGVSLSHCGGKSRFDNGNGALMRILPIAMYTQIKPHYTFLDILYEIELVRDVAGLTHNHLISHIACYIYTFVVKNLMNDLDKNVAVFDAVSLVKNQYGRTEEWQEFNRLHELITRNRTQIKSTGYVVDTLEAALWCFLSTESYRDCVLLAANLGDDTDTIAAISGGLAGIYYGTKSLTGVPMKWIELLPRHNWIKELCDQYEKIQLDEVLYEE